jgi:hypothetical protein
VESKTCIAWGGVDAEDAADHVAFFQRNCIPRLLPDEVMGEERVFAYVLNVEAKIVDLALAETDMQTAIENEPKLERQRMPPSVESAEHSIPALDTGAPLPVTEQQFDGAFVFPFG